MREVQKKNIGGVEYVCTMLPATKAQRLFVELVQLIGRPALAAIAQAFTASEIKEHGFGDVTVEALASDGLRSFITMLEPDTADRLVRLVMTEVRADGQSLADDATFDNHFRGRILDLYKVFAWAIRVNFQDFFDAARSNDTIASIGRGGIAAFRTKTSPERSPDSSSPPTAESTPAH